jgi:hypothetical protein
MTPRILPPEEWHRLKGTEAERLWPMLSPDHSRVVVVEEDGEIVGCHVLVWLLHAECLWIAPEKRAKASVARRLWQGVQDVVVASNAHAVITAAVDDRVRGLIATAGGSVIPGEHYVVPVQSTDERRDLRIGKMFHEQLERQLTSDNHPDDDAHNKAVGRALRTAIEHGDATKAVDEYNQWASLSGYAPVTIVSEGLGTWVVDIQTAIIRIDADYGVTVMEERVPSCQ